MDLISEIEKAALATGKIKTVFVANLNEANYGLDALKPSEYPVLLVLGPVVADDLGMSGLWEGEVNLEFQVLDRDPDGKTIDYKTIEIEKRFTAPMRMLGRQFISILNQSLIVQDMMKRCIWTPTYGAFDAHVHGVLGSGRLKIVEQHEC